eukprot:366841-Rhodomonas_salina.7
MKRIRRIRRMKRWRRRRRSRSRSRRRRVSKKSGSKRSIGSKGQGGGGGGGGGCIERARCSTSFACFVQSFGYVWYRDASLWVFASSILLGRTLGYCDLLSA